MNEDEFDIVIPLGSNDLNIIEKQLIHTKKNIVGFRNIYIVTNENMNVQCLKDIDPRIFIINENIYPFSISDVSNIHGKSSRNGWYLQQLIKLYSGFVIDDILKCYLVIDADTFFLKPTTFQCNGKLLYNFGFENHIHYFNHMKKLHPSFIKQSNHSGICHHMIFDREVLEEILGMVETYADGITPFWVLFLENVEPSQRKLSGASEYELYFNFIIQFGKNVEIRELKWDNVSTMAKYETENLNYVSWHHYKRFI